MIEFEIGGNQYRAEKLNAFQQLHVSRKIAPLIPKLVPVFLSVKDMQGKIKDNIGAIAGVLQPFADALAELPDESAEYVIVTCLSVVRRKQGDNYTPVWSNSHKTMMFTDLEDIAAIIPIVSRVIQGYLSPFIAGFLTSQQEPTPAAAE